MRILHLSDTHFTKKNDDVEITSIINAQPSLTEKFERLFQQENMNEIDLVVITGDLVHDSDRAEYEAYFGFIEQTFSGKKVHFALGNHDTKNEFNQAMFDKDISDFYQYSIVQDNVHILIFDTATPGKHTGHFSEEQLEWMEAELAKNSLPKMIFQHHPLMGDDYFQDFLVEEPEKALAILAEYNVIGVFTGHTHLPAVNLKDQVLQYTTYGMAFGIEKLADQSSNFTNTNGYSVIHYENGHLTVTPRILYPEFSVYLSYSEDGIKELNESYEY